MILSSFSLSGLLGLAIHHRKRGRQELGIIAEVAHRPGPEEALGTEVEEADHFDFDGEALESDSTDKTPPALGKAKLKSWDEGGPRMPRESAPIPMADPSCCEPLAPEYTDIQDTQPEGPVGERSSRAGSSIAHDRPQEEDPGASMKEDIGELKGSDQSFPDFIIEI